MYNHIQLANMVSLCLFWSNHDDVWVGFQRFPGNDTYLWFNGEALQAEKFDNWKPG